MSELPDRQAKRDGTIVKFVCDSTGSDAVKISVAMCTYNGAAHLWEQLHSIASQTRLPDELIVCDDRSTDETIDIVEEFAAQRPFPVRLHVNEENLGSTKNFERAIELCDGDVIALSDQDDVWHPEKLSRIEAAFISAPEAGLVFTNADVVDEELRPLPYTLWQGHGFTPSEQTVFKNGGAFERLLERNVVTGAAMAFRSRFKQLVLPVPTDMTSLYGNVMIHDGWIAVIIAAVAEIIFVDENLFKYRQHARQQLGVILPTNTKKTMTARERWEDARRSHLAAFAVELRRLGVIHRRLLKHADLFGRTKAVRQLEARINHTRIRSELHKSKLMRLPSVCKELLSLRYHRYSNGIRSVVKDMFM